MHLILLDWVRQKASKQLWCSFMQDQDTVQCRRKEAREGGRQGREGQGNGGRKGYGADRRREEGGSLKGGGRKEWMD